MCGIKKSQSQNVLERDMSDVSSGLKNSQENLRNSQTYLLRTFRNINQINFSSKNPVICNFRILASFEPFYVSRMSTGCYQNSGNRPFTNSEMRVGIQTVLCSHVISGRISIEDF